MERLCQCGNKINSMSGSVKCKDCRACDAYAKKEIAQRKRLEATTKAAKEAGLIQLHSCLSNILDPPVADCLCRKFVTFEVAQKLIRTGQAVDYENREACFHKRPIVESGRHRHTPRGATIERAHIMRGVQSLKTRSIQGKTEEQLRAEVQELERRIQEDRLEQSEDERHRWGVWAELQQIWLKSITVMVPDSEWLAGEKAARGIPACQTIGKDERSSVGRSIGSSRFESSIDEFDTSDRESDDETVIEVNEVDTESEVEPEDDVESESEFEPESEFELEPDVEDLNNEGDQIEFEVVAEAA